MMTHMMKRVRCESLGGTGLRKHGQNEAQRLLGMALEALVLGKQAGELDRLKAMPPSHPNFDARPGRGRCAGSGSDFHGNLRCIFPAREKGARPLRRNLTCIKSTPNPDPVSSPAGDRTGIDRMLASPTPTVSEPSA